MIKHTFLTSGHGTALSPEGLWTSATTAVATFRPNSIFMYVMGLLSRTASEYKLFGICIHVTLATVEVLWYAVFCLLNSFRMTGLLNLKSSEIGQYVVA